MFDILDPGSESGQVYRALVANPRSSAQALVERTRLTNETVRTALEDLAKADVVIRVDSGRWDAAPPDQVASVMSRWEDDRRKQMRDAADELARIFWFARWERSHYPALEVIEDVPTLLAQYRNLQLGAGHEMRGIDRPPYFSDVLDTADQEQLQRERMAAGVRYRAIYHEACYEDPVRGAGMMRYVRAGEQARTLDDPPVKLVIGDDQCALIPFDPFGSAKSVSLMVRPSGLLTALMNVYEALWRLAVPVSAEGGQGSLDERDREIITLMAAGATDDAIARQLRLSRRTVVRRTANLLSRLGATTRFQAGVQASRRGWL